MGTTLPVAVVIPAWRSATTLGATLESIFAQTCPPTEVVVVDDGSPDDIEGVVAPYGEEVRSVRQENKGPGAARNLGARMTRAPLLAFLDADDLWLPEFLARSVDTLERNSEADLTFADAWDWDGKERLGRRHDQGGPPPGGASLESLVLGNYIPLLTVLVRRCAFQRVGGFDEDRQVMSMEDYDLWLRILVTGQAVYIPEPLALYRRTAGSLGSNANLLAALAVVHGKLQAEKGGADLAAAMVRREALTRRDLAGDLLAQGEYGAARREALRALWRMPLSWVTWKLLLRGLLGKYFS